MKEKKELRDYVSPLNKQTKIQKTPETVPNEIETSDLSDKEFKVMVIKTLTEVTRNIHEQTENWNQKTDSIKMYQAEMTELKHIVIYWKQINKWVQQ